MTKTFQSKIPGVKLTIKFEDGDMTDADFLRLAKKCQEFVDSFDSVEEFQEALERAAKQVGAWENIH